MNVIASTASYHTLVQWLMLQHNEVKQDHSVSLQQETMDNIPISALTDWNFETCAKHQ